jgi:ribosome-binding factor A
LGKKRRERDLGPITGADDAHLIDRFFSGFEEGSGHSAAPSEDRKLKQLVREAYRVLSQAVGELADQRLAAAFVVDVRPGPDGSRLVVAVSAGGGVPAEVLAALDAARGNLRGELASALSRKRTPELSFEVVP